MSLRTLQTAFGILTVAATLSAASLSSSFSAHLYGEVRNVAGVPQMGATVALYNRYDQEIRHVLTTESGKFVFDQLTPDIYSVRVTLASFMPALRKNLALAAGSDNLLRINLASVFSTVELVPAAAASSALMSDEWKWVLRASQATRPVLRYLPGKDPSSTTASTSRIAPLFSGTTGVVRVSAGDSGDSAAQGGTSFALSTRMNGNANVHVSGTFGYTTGAGLPAAALRATYARDGEGGPEISLSVRQINVPALAGSGPVDGPALRSASLTLREKTQLTEEILIEYGVALDSASYLSKVTEASPFARASYKVGDVGVVRVAFSSGTQPTGLNPARGEIAATSELNQDLAALSYTPGLSQRDGNLKMERDQRWEAGYESTAGPVRVAAAAFREDVRNGIADSVGGRGIFDMSEVLRDFDSANAIVNIGSYQRSGYAVGMSRSLGEHFEVAVSGGRGGALLSQGHVLNLNSSSDARSWLRQGDRPWVTARLSGTVPHAGTRISTSYGWTDFNSLVPQHAFLTSGLIDQELGWNMSIRQPLPSSFSGNRGRVEAGAEVRNLLSDGYLLMYLGQAHSLLSSSPRLVRGSLSFIF